MTEPLHVLIIGGGISGLCLAHGLHAAGISATVYERDQSPTDRPEGYRLHINPAGSRALGACLPAPLWRAIVATSGRPGPLAFLTEQRRPLATLPDGGPGDDPREASHCVDRATLRQLLLHGLDGVRFGHRFTRLEQNGSGVTAHFQDGSRARGDVLVAADGAGSGVAAQHLPGTDRRAAEASSIAFKVPLDDATRAWLPLRWSTGMTMTSPTAPTSLFTSAFVRDQDAEQALDRLQQATGSRPDLVTDPTVPYDDYVLCTLIVDQAALPRDVAERDAAGLRDLYLQHTACWDPAYRRLVDSCDTGSISLVTHRSSTPVPAWPTTRVTFVGDAVHSMTPVGGLGGNAALRDAHLLTRALTEVHTGRADLTQALRGYERQLRRHGYSALRTAEKTQRRGTCSGRARVTAQRVGLRIVTRVAPLRRAAAPFSKQASAVPAEAGGRRHPAPAPRS